MADKIHNINDYINYESKICLSEKIVSKWIKEIQLYVYERYV